MKKIVVLLLGLLVFFFLVKRVYRFIESDKCLDRGGSWNYETDTCDYGLRVKYGGYWITDFKSLFDTSSIEESFELESTVRYTIETDSGSYEHIYKGDTLFDIRLSNEIDLMEFRFTDDIKGVLNSLSWDSTTNSYITEPSIISYTSRFEFLAYDKVRLMDGQEFSDTLDISSLKPDVIKIGMDTLYRFNIQ